MTKPVPDSASDPLSNKALDLTSVAPAVPKPGQLFRRERLEKKWTKEHVAKALLLSVQHVEALENDEYDKLPGTTYVIGYWRSYANLLEIDISESIKFHKTNLKISPSVIALEAGHHRAHNHQEKARRRSGLVFFILSAIFLSGIWYWQNPVDTPLNQWISDRSKTDVNNDDQSVIKNITPIAVMDPEGYFNNGVSNFNFSDDIANADVEPEDAATTEDEDNIENNVEDNKDLPLNPPVSNYQATSQEVDSAQRELTPSTETVSEPVAEIPVAETPVVETPVVEIPVAETPVAETPVAETPVAETSVAETSVAETPVADSPNWIFLSVEKKSWLDVRDVIGDKLIYRLANVGESISLKGQPPFYVFIGTADGVHVEYLGKPFSFKIEDDNPVARFRVGEVEIKKTNEQ